MPNAPVDDPALAVALAADYAGEGAGRLRSLIEANPRRSLFLRAAFWAVVLSAYFIVAYNGCNWVASKRLHVGTLYYGWERYIPFVPLAIFPYMSIDLFFFFSPFLCRDLFELRTHARRIMLAITFSSICFLLFPLAMGTTHPPVKGMAGMLFALLEGFDRPYNLVPSLHIALLCTLWVIYSRHTRGAVRALVQAWFVLIAVSTLLTNQHHFIDLVGGYILGLICFYLFPDIDAAREAIADRFTTPRVRNVRVARHYGMGAMLLAICTWLTYPWGLLLLWPALAGAVVSAAYFRLGVTVFQKRDGRIPWSSRILLGPFFLVAWIVRRRFRRACDPYCEISPGLFVGGRLTRPQARELRGRGIGAVVDLTAECAESPLLRDLHYLNVPLLDLTAPTLADLNAGVAFIRTHADRGVYVHCAIGYSRSVCMVAAWLIASNQADSVEKSFDAIRKVRSVALLDDTSRQVLQAYLEGLPT